MKRLLIVDIEATCHEENDIPEGFISEVIEIGAVLLNTKNFNIEAQYDVFVKPALFPILNDFCLELTSIRQVDVDGGLSLEDALSGLLEIFNPKRAVFASWGYYDANQLKKECSLKGVNYPFPDHFSLKHEHAHFYNLPVKGMISAMRHHDILLEGSHHRGIDDARNISKIAVQMLEDGWSHKLMLY